MKKYVILLLLAVCGFATVHAQVSNTGFIDTNTVVVPGKVTVGAYVDAYYGVDLGRTATNDRPYAVSFARTDEMNVNLAYVDVKYSSSTIRARFVPAFGSYMAANYSAEPIQLRNLLEASVGFRLSEKGNVWVDAGVIGSPYTNESAISRDHLMLTRSLAAEYVPYYLSGVRVGAQLSSQVNVYGYLLNGWQNIQETNRQKSFGTQVEYRPTDKLLINWNTYLGYEETLLMPRDRGRYFTDVYMIYNPDGKFSMTACAYVGNQQRQDTSSATWYNANVIGRYRVTPKVSLAARYEWFNDPNAAVSSNIVGMPGQGLVTQSATVGITYKLQNYILLRADYRQFFGGNKVFNDRDGAPTAQNGWLVAGVNIIY